jgi:streptogramin lyase
VTKESSRASAMAYDPDDKVVLIAAGRAIISATSPLSPISLPTSDVGGITGLAYSASQHAVYFSSPTSIYRAAGGSVTLVANGFQAIDALTVDDHGTPFAIDSEDHVSTVSSGVATPLTPPGSVGQDTSAFNASLLPPIYAQIVFNSQDGALYVTDPGQGVVKRVTTSGTVTTFAGMCPGPSTSVLQSTCTPATGPGANARFAYPAGIAYNVGTKTLYVTDLGNNQLLGLASDGTATIVAGYGAPGNVDGNGFRALLDAPFLLTSASDSGLVYIGENDSAAATAPGFTLASYATSGIAAAPYTSPVLAFPAQVFPLTTQPPAGIAVASDGSAWIAQPYNNKVAHVSLSGRSEFALPSGFTLPTLPAFPNVPAGIVVDASDNVWFIANQVNASVLVRMRPDGTQTVYSSQLPAPNTFSSLAIGPDGKPWFGGEDANSTFLGFADATSGALITYPIGGVLTTPFSNVLAAGPWALTSGPDGNLWFSMPPQQSPPVVKTPGGTANPPTFPTTSSSGVIQRMTPGGQLLASFPTTQTPTAFAIQPASVWYVTGSGTLWKMTSTGVESETPLGTTACNPCNYFPSVDSVTAAPDGSIWVAESQDVARVDSSGAVTRYLLPQGFGIGAIASRPDGKLWVIGSGAVFLLDQQAYDLDRLPHLTAQSLARQVMPKALRVQPIR